jgi:hypothetical protein
MDPEQRGQHRDEKQDEKQGEKEQEKHQEKGRSLDEKYKRNPVRMLSLAALIIWLGISLLLQQNIDAIGSGDRGWGLFFWGWAVIVFVEVFARLAIPKWRRPVVGSFVWGAIMVGIGFGLWFGKWEIIGPVVLIAIGVAILLGRLIPRR